jgi:hypothetical protein
MMRKRRNMRPRNMGMMAGLAGLRDRMRPARNMMFGGGRQLNPFLGMNNLPRKNGFLPPLSKLPPQPGGNRKFLDMLGSGASSDIMPQNPGFGVNLPKPRPIMPGFTPNDRIGNYNLEKENFFGTPSQPQPTGPVNPSLLKPPGYEPPKDDYSGYLSFYDNPPVPGMKAGGEADSSEFPDLSGDGKITEKDILMGKGVIKMGTGGDPADKVEESFTDYQPEGVLKGSIFDYIPDGYQVSAFLQDKLSRPMPLKSDLPMIDNDADMMNIQRGRQEYQKFYFGLPEALRAGLPSPDEVYGDNQMSGDIDMMLEDLASPEKKSLNPPMMFR